MSFRGNLWSTHIDDTGNVILEHPLQRLVVLRVDAFKISHIDASTQNLLVERSVEVRVEQSAVVDGFTDDPADKPEVFKVMHVADRQRDELRRWSETYATADALFGWYVS